jgi:hypothetical protein
MEEQMPSNEGWERIGAATGIAFVIFLIASFVVIPEAPPSLSDPVGDIKSFYVDHSGNIQASAFLTGIAAFFFLWFLGSLTTALRRAEGEGGRLSTIVFGAGVITLAFPLVAAAINTTLATRIAAESDQAVIRALYEVQAFAGAFVAFPLAALVGGTSLVSLRTGLFPRWLTLGGYALTPGWLIGGTAVFTEDGFFSPTGAYGLIVLALWLAWVLSLSILLTRGVGQTAAT